MNRRIHLSGLAAGLLLLVLMGCARQQGLVIAPAAVIVEVGETVAFTAADEFGIPVSVRWAVSTGPGDITPAGAYTAPASVPQVTNAVVTATRVSYPTVAGSAVVTIRPPVTAGVVDAVGDTFGSNTYDIASVRTSRTSTTLVVLLAFSPATPPSLPQSGSVVAAGELAGFIDLDTDERPATGVDSANSTFCPCTPISAIGSDFFVSLFARNDAGNYDIIDVRTLSDVGDAIPKLEGNVLTLLGTAEQVGVDGTSTHG